MIKLSKDAQKNRKTTLSAKDLAKDPTPEENPKYGSKSHKNS